jgi:hypothetical protein
MLVKLRNGFFIIRSAKIMQAAAAQIIACLSLKVRNPSQEVLNIYREPVRLETPTAKD